MLVCNALIEVLMFVHELLPGKLLMVHAVLTEVLLFVHELTEVLMSVQ